MISLFTFTTPTHECAYLPGRQARLAYEVVARMSPAEYQAKMDAGWRRFGMQMFTHDCPECTACQSLRIDVARFLPIRSQKRAWKANEDLELSIHQPSVTPEKLELFERYHAARSEQVGWREKDTVDATSYIESYVRQPFPVEEWQYHLNGVLVGVGYVDSLPESLSAIYFYYDPLCEVRSIGTFNVLRVLAAANERGLPWVHLGFTVSGCRSLEYKMKFKPFELLGSDGNWRTFSD